VLVRKCTSPHNLPRLNSQLIAQSTNVLIESTSASFESVVSLSLVDQPVPPNFRALWDHTTCYSSNLSSQLNVALCVLVHVFATRYIKISMDPCHSAKCLFKKCILATRKSHVKCLLVFNNNSTCTSLRKTLQWLWVSLAPLCDVESLNIKFDGHAQNKRNRNKRRRWKMEDLALPLVVLQ